ncbi:MAG: hypothetical protein NC420_04990 [Eubacterium sp.]|nr:hypothetical protein [Eubacterium sp.]MCM1303168.1 hypothetical protein [Butyrivibrio sp.]MCM1344230.1 hypothetical protein [Muribaculaceae bacterium]MCM1409483.1 hypothetical protein [Lachnospiraceae bacterium]
MSEQAVKIFEALSDVDGELLERCEQKASQKTGAVYGIYRRYGKAMAACLCLMAVGAAAWGGYRLATDRAGQDLSGAADMAQMSQSMAAADCGAPEGNGEAEREEAENEAALADGIMTEAVPVPAAGSTEVTGPQAAQSMSGQKEAGKISDQTSLDRSDGTEAAGAASQEVSQAESQADKYAQLREQENALCDSREEIPWGEACTTEPFRSYLPTVLPTGYEAFSARRSALPEQWNNIIFKWADGGHIFFLNMTQGEVVTREDIERRDGLNEYMAEDFRRERMPDPPAGEPLAFALYYADGMRIDFNGYITADEMWAVVESMGR